MNDYADSKRHQQTVRLAIDCETGELIAAETLLTLPEVEFTAFRRQAMQARLDRRRGSSAERFLCAICKGSLYLSRHRGTAGTQNRWFVHDTKAVECPWSEGRRLAPNQVKALVYRGQQEGHQHREMKEYIASWLKKDQAVSEVSLEQTTFSEVVKGEWRRPDVRCLYNGVPLVFEIQLSYTFLSDVIARDAFYRRERTSVIWVFAKFDRSRAVVTDEAFFNKRNLFVLDDQARQNTLARGSLTFSGYHQKPTLEDDSQWNDRWQAMPISLHDMRFPTDTWRPFFFDYEEERLRLEHDRLAALRADQSLQWANSVAAYLDAALRFFDSGHGKNERDALLAVVDEMEVNPAWQQGFEALRDSRFFGYHGVLAVLLSIHHERPISYSAELSVFRVIEAGLRTSSSVGKHAFAIQYLLAYKKRKPNISQRNHRWLVEYAHTIKESLENEEVTYRRDTIYDEAIGLLFPELKAALANPLGTDVNLLATTKDG